METRIKQSDCVGLELVWENYRQLFTNLIKKSEEKNGKEMERNTWKTD